MIDLTVNEAVLKSAVQRAKVRDFKIPTFKQMRDPSLIPDDVKERLADVGLWDLDPINLYRITWHNEAKASGGGFGGVNYFEVPSSISGVDARIVMMEGKWFPTGAHKVGAAFGCLVPRLVAGPPRKPFGRRPATTVAVAHTTRISLRASRSRSCPRV